MSKIGLNVNKASASENRDDSSLVRARRTTSLAFN